MADGTLRLVYAGALTPTYELDVVVRALALIAGDRPELAGRPRRLRPRRRRAGLVEQAAELGIAERVTFHGRIPIEDVPAAIAAADIGVAPTRRDPFTEVSLSTKVFEYAAMGKPVVASRLPAARGPLPAGARRRTRRATRQRWRRRSCASSTIPVARDAGAARPRARARELSWDHEAPEYVALVESVAGDAPVDCRWLTAGRRTARARRPGRAPVGEPPSARGPHQRPQLVDPGEVDPALDPVHDHEVGRPDEAPISGWFRRSVCGSRSTPRRTARSPACSARRSCRRRSRSRPGTSGRSPVEI